MGSYKDSNELTEKCDEAIAEVPLKEIYQQSDNLISEAKSLYDTSIKENIVKAISKLEQAEKSFTKLNKYRNSIEKATECRTKIQTYQGKIGELDELNKKAEQAKKHRNKIIVICASISIIVIATITLTVNFIIPSIKYNNAVAMLENGQYDEAITAFTDLGNYKDSINKITETQNAKTEFERNQKYDSANKLFEEKKYDEAITAFTDLGDYKDSSNKIIEIKYLQANKLVDEKRYGEAIIAFTELGDYKDSKQKHDESILNLQKTFSISTGDNHTVGLKADGTVVATGDNEDGKCDVSGWKDIIAISAGDSHTVGLKKDGTVVATGYNKYGQCDVSDWILKVN